MSESANRAVFLSYASQDAEAARRIAETLRAAGVEVWFDQSELVGGDAWDRKIRRQINSCALFVPIISQNTQARTEGYFRLEWRLAEQRTFLMAKGRPFLLPIVIDETRDAEAHVPDAFLEVQWSRFPDGNCDANFAAHVERLLNWDGSAAPRAPLESVPARRKRRPALILGAILAMVVGAGVAVWVTTRSKESPPAPPPPAPVVSKARELALKAQAQMQRTDRSRAELAAADDLCKLATQEDPTDAFAWAIWSEVDGWYVFHNWDTSVSRRAAARDCATRALQLDPTGYESRLAQAFYWVRCEPWNHPTQKPGGAAGQLLRTLLTERPDEPRALLTLGVLKFHQGRVEEAQTLLERLEHNPAYAAEATKEAAWQLFLSGKIRRAEPILDRSLGYLPYWDNLGLKVYMALVWNGDLDLAKATLDRMPASALQEDWGATLFYWVHSWRREPQANIEFLESLPREWLSSALFAGPKTFLLGMARLQAGQSAAAAREFRRALELVEKRLADDPNNPGLLGLKARALHHLNEVTEAEKTYRLFCEINAKPPPEFAVLFETADQAIDGIEAGHGSFAQFTAASLRLDPSYDPLRSDPRFAAILAHAEADPRRSPKAKAAGDSSSSVPQVETSPPDQKSVAVLAFANLSDDKDNEYFSDGVSEDLIDVLAKIPGLKVTARTSSFSFKGRDVPVPEIARKLGVAYVVEGSVRKQGDRVRISAQLIKASDGFNVWSDTFTRELKDVFAVQDEIAGLVAKQLQLKLGDAQAHNQQVNPKALQPYLQGRYLMNQFTLESNRSAVEKLREAVGADPSFAPAWAALSLAAATVGGYSENRQEFEDSFRQARESAERALALDPDLAAAHLAMAKVQSWHDYDWKGLKDSLQLARSLAPADVDVIRALAEMNFTFGRLDSAVELARQSVALDPVNSEMRLILGLSLDSQGRFDKAEEEFRQMIDLNPASLWGHSGVGMVYIDQGRFSEAEGEAAQEGPEWARLFLTAMAHWGLKKFPESDEALALLTRKFSAVAAYQVAEVHAFRGESDEAFAWLERAYRQRDAGIVWCKADRLLRSLHGDPRWDAFMRKLGLADDQLP